jgi:HEAT repeat protein
VDDGLDAVGTDELVARALVLDDDDEAQDEQYWAIVAALQRRGDDEVFEAARELCEEPSDKARCLGVAVLGGIGDAARGRPFLEQSLPLVLELCTDDASEDLLAACLHALGSLEDPRALGAVIAQRRHHDPVVRLAVAHALAPVAEEPPAPAAVAAVMELMRDPDDDVRDWATFSLGTLFELDTPAIRDALVQQLGDRDEGVVAEALAGLAARGDTRGNDVLLARLEAAIARPFDDSHVADLILEAAAQLGDPRFGAALEILRARAR